MKYSVTNEFVENLLKEHDIRPTAVRIMVWKEIMNFDFAFALSDLEGALPTADRSTLFRALTLFVNQHLLHTIDDGSGQQKYCICHELEQHDFCHEERSNTHKDCQHVHLSCTICGRTFCLRSQKIPSVQVPEGFTILHAQYLIQGICPHCAHKTKLDGSRSKCCCHNTD